MLYIMLLLELCIYKQLTAFSVSDAIQFQSFFAFCNLLLILDLNSVNVIFGCGRS